MVHYGEAHGPLWGGALRGGPWSITGAHYGEARGPVWEGPLYAKLYVYQARGTMHIKPM